jgi:hypothetical protein
MPFLALFRASAGVRKLAGTFAAPPTAAVHNTRRPDEKTLSVVVPFEIGKHLTLDRTRFKLEACLSAHGNLPPTRS